MKQSDLYRLLVVPLFLIALSTASLLGSTSLDSFDEEMGEEALAQARLESRLADMETKINNDEEIITKENAQELLSISGSTLNAVKGLFEQYGDFSGEIGLWAKRQSYSVILFSLLNIFFVILVYRSSKR